jgi:glycosyltransferase involved in cell wall biosynthesis
MGVTSLHLCTSEAWGGLELYACTLMAALKSAGGRVLAVTAPGSKVDAYLSAEGIPVYHLPGRIAPSPRAVSLLGRLVKREHVDVIHVHFHRDVWNASLALRRDPLKKLFLSIYMGVSSKKDILHRYIYRRVDAVFTSSRELNRRLVDLYPIPPERIHYLPYGRAIERYRRDESKRALIRRKYGVREGELLVGTMVHIDPGKGAMDFARSFSYITGDLQPSIKYLIVGEPTRKGRSRPDESPFEEHCEAYQREIERYRDSENLGQNIILAGFQEDLIGYLSAMDIFVFPSRDELYSLVVLDAMCMGMPVVAARAGGTIAQIEDGARGLLYEVGNSRDCAARVSQYARSPELRAQHGKAARLFVEEHHSMSSTIKTLLEFYS